MDEADDDDNASEASNSWEEANEDVPLDVVQAGLQRPGVPPGAAQFR